MNTIILGRAEVAIIDGDYYNFKGWGQEQECGSENRLGS